MIQQCPTVDLLPIKEGAVGTGQILQEIAITSARDARLFAGCCQISFQNEIVLPRATDAHFAEKETGWKSGRQVHKGSVPAIGGFFSSNVHGSKFSKAKGGEEQGLLRVVQSLLINCGKVVA